MPAICDATRLLEQLRWRYAVKQFDPVKKIPDESWLALEQSLVLAPSSFGVQPWKFIVVESPSIREQLTPVSWNQRQVVDASHFIVFAARKRFGETEIDRHIARVAEVRSSTLDSLGGLRKAVLGFVDRAEVNVPEWAARQVYLALGSFLTCAAVLGIDACPMEGIERDAFDRILGLDQSDFTTWVAAAAGYRSTSDGYAQLLKVRFPHEDVVQHV